MTEQRDVLRLDLEGDILAQLDKIEAEFKATSEAQAAAAADNAAAVLEVEGAYAALLETQTARRNDLRAMSAALKDAAAAEEAARGKGPEHAAALKALRDQRAAYRELNSAQKAGREELEAMQRALAELAAEGAQIGKLNGTFEGFLQSQRDWRDITRDIKADNLPGQLKALDSLFRSGRISATEHARALNAVRLGANDITDKFKLAGDAGEALANKLEGISDPVRRLALEQKLWNAQNRLGVRGVKALNSRLAEADAEIFAYTDGLVSLKDVTNLAATAWLSLGAAVGAAAAGLVGVGASAIAQAAEDNIYLRKQLEALEVQYETLQTRLGQTLLGGNDAVGGFDTASGALEAFNALLTENEEVFRAILPTILDVGETLVQIFSYTAPAALSPLLVLVDSIKFAFTGVLATIGHGAGMLADLALQLGVIDADSAKTWRNFRDWTKEAFDDVGLNSWTEKVWEAGGAVRDLAADLKGAAGESARLVSSMDKLYILQNKDMFKGAVDAYESATKEFISLGIGRAEAERLAVESLPAAQRKVFDEMLKSTEDFNAEIVTKSKEKNKASAEADLDALDAEAEYRAKQLQYAQESQKRIDAAEEHYARLSIQRGERAAAAEDAGTAEREAALRERFKNVQSQIVGFSDTLREAKLNPELSDADVEKIKAQYFGLITELYTLYESAPGTFGLRAELEGVIDTTVELGEVLGGLESASPWPVIGAQMADVARGGLADITAGALEMAGAFAAGKGKASDFGKFLKAQMISMGKTLAPILYSAGLGVEATRWADGAGMVAAGLGLSLVLGAVGAMGGGSGRRRQTQTAAYDFAAVQDRFQKANENQKAPQITVYAQFDADQLEATTARLVQEGQRRGLYGRRV